MEAPSVALSVFKMSQKLLNAHSNMTGAALFYDIGTKNNTVGLHDVNRAAHVIF
jgi:hypothetical protein